MTNVIVTVNEGKIRGLKTRSKFSDAEFYAFFGVPYGQSTAGQARFKDPIKVKPWKGIIDGTIEKNGCLQFSLILKRFVGSEDCLFNNIYTPNLQVDGAPLKPVIVSIHGGGHFYGSPATNVYGSPEYIMHRDIVYVCVSFRLHILGFLNLNLEDCSGNQALKDIILSLQWIKENIHVFGGDPNNVTIMGTSSGATLVHALMLSPRAKGLFHKAILMGMYLLSPSINIKTDHATIAAEIAQINGLKKENSTDTKKLLSFYKKSKDIIIKAISLRLERIYHNDQAILFPACPFSMTIDRGENPIFPKSPEKLVDSTTRIPLLFGISERETAMGFTEPYRKGTMNHFYETYRQNEWGWGHNITDEEVQLIKEKISSFYLKNGTIEGVPLSLKVDIQTDIAFSDVYDTLINIISADLPSSVYVYKFEFDGAVSTMKNLIQPLLEEPLSGPHHAADFSYWAKIKFIPECPRTRKMVETFTKLVSNFAKTGNPNCEDLNVEWKPSTPENPCYLRINQEHSMIDGKLNGERMEFWKEVIKRFKK